LTLSDVIRMAGPRLDSIGSATRTGNSAMCQLGAKPNHYIRPNRIARLIAKSMRATTAEEGGIIKRGKYTPMALDFPTRLEASPRIVENRNYGSMPANHAGDKVARLARQFGEPAEHNRECGEVVPLRHASSELAIGQCVARSNDIKAERGSAGRLRLQKRDGKAFASRGHHEQIGHAVGLRGVLSATA
jgi:hypothetical protein